MPPPSHGGTTGSNPVGDTNEFSALLDQAATCAGCIRYYMHRAVLPLSGRGKVSVASGRPTMCYHPLFRRASARFFPLTRPRQTDRGEGVAALLAQTRATPRLCARSSSRAAPGHHLGRGARDIGLPQPRRPQKEKRPPTNLRWRAPDAEFGDHALWCEPSLAIRAFFNGSSCPISVTRDTRRDRLNCLDTGYPGGAK